MQESLIPYLGGKTKLSKEIIKRMPEHTLYVEVFCGGAAVFFRKPPSKAEIINDINDDIFNLYRVIQSHAPEFLRLAEDTPLSRSEHNRYKQGHYKNNTEINRAITFYRVLRSSFGAKLNGSFCIPTTRKSSTRTAVTLKRVEAAKKRLESAYIENLNYADLISKYDKESTFFCLDPPYYDKEEFYGKDIFSKKDFFNYQNY